MKLLALTNRYYIFIAILSVLTANTYIMFRVLHFVDTETKEHIKFENELLKKQLHSQSFLKGKTLEFGDYVSVHPIERITFSDISFRDTSFYDAKEFGIVPFTEFTQQEIIDGLPLQIKIRKRLIENEDILASITIPFILTSLMIIISFFFLNKWFTNTKLKPFYIALDELKKFDVRKKDNLRLLNTNIFEFNSLNSELLKLTTKVKDHYHELKEFTENVSHESKTPITVVRMRLEMLLQSPNLDEKEKIQISSALDAIHRLTEKNNALQLISKIESNQFSQKINVEVNATVKKLIEDMHDFISLKQLSLDITDESKIIINANAHLIEILFANLLGNAIKYNFEGGCIKVTISNYLITIANSGSPLSIPASEIFERYAKSDHPESSGLGLAIAKKICSLYDYILIYEYKNDMHQFSCRF